MAAAASASASGTPELVAAVLANAPQGAEERCSYTRTRIDGDTSRRERYRPGHPETPWVLEKVNGDTPSEDALRHYAEGSGDRQRRHPLAFDLRSMVAADGWALRSESDARAVFEFRLRPTEDIDDALVDKVLGTLVVDKTRRQPVHISIVNTEAAYVAPLVRIASYSQQLSFRWEESLGVAALAEIETRWRGRALGLKTISKHELVRYGDYHCAGAAAGAAGR